MSCSNGLPQPPCHAIVCDADRCCNSTGIVGTKHLFDSLSAPQEAQMGRADVALAIVTNPTYPGYGYWLSQGATSLWETWEGVRFHPHSSWNQ